MTGILGFDVYGTLIDVHGVVSKIEEVIGTKQPKEFSQTWREKQLEYTFRRGLMQNYQNFGVCTSQALDYACKYYNVTISKEQKQELLDCYKTLPAFADVKQDLMRLKDAGYRLYAFSNGSAEAVNTVLVSAGIREFFIGVVSVDDLKSYKPNPAVYSYFLRESGGSGNNAWLVSSNPFDVIGAISTGMRAAWVQRSKEAIFDPWEIEPTLTVNNIGELQKKLELFND